MAVGVKVIRRSGRATRRKEARVLRDVKDWGQHRRRLGGEWKIGTKWRIWRGRERVTDRRRSRRDRRRRNKRQM